MCMRFQWCLINNFLRTIRTLSDMQSDNNPYLNEFHNSFCTIRPSDLEFRGQGAKEKDETLPHLRGVHSSPIEPPNITYQASKWAPSLSNFEVLPQVRWFSRRLGVKRLLTNFSWLTVDWWLMHEGQLTMPASELKKVDMFCHRYYTLDIWSKENYKYFESYKPFFMNWSQL